jgi:hypothetical protein
MYTVIIEGIEVRCGSADEAVALAKHAASLPRSVTAAVQFNGNSRPDVIVPIHGGKGGQLLIEVKKAGGPVSAATLVSSLALDNGQSLGPLFSGIKTTLGKYHIDIEQVIRKGRAADGKTYWEPGPKLDDALREAYKMTG